jgi:hypothetical protein
LNPEPLNPYIFRLFPSSLELGIELESALALGALGILIRFFLTELHLCTEAVRAFKVRKDFLNMTPLAACQFHDVLLAKEIA